MPEKRNITPTEGTPFKRPYFALKPWLVGCFMSIYPRRNFKRSTFGKIYQHIKLVSCNR